VKFTGRGGEVLVSTTYSLDGPVRLEVLDTGSGMSEATIASSLDPDHPPPPGPRTAGGMGFGLPLVRALATANGSDIEIESVEGEGTLVALVFPKDRVIPV
jgi:signal transduction histidine kinase